MKKGFTLVELMAVIILLGVIALIAYPTITGTVNNAKQKAYEETIRQIEYAASRYAVENVFDLPMDGNTVTQITISQLINLGYIQKTENGKLYNPIDSTEMTGCVLIQYDPYYTQYMYEYSENCSGQIVYAPPTVRFEVLDATPVNGWYNEGFYVKATITDNSELGIKESYTCVGEATCTPNTKLEELEKTFYIENQGNNRMCIKTIDNNNKETTLCSDIYKLDAIAPTITTSDEVITITKGNDKDAATYFNINYSISGGSVSCNHSNIKTLLEGTQTITCTVTGNNGLSSDETKTFNVLYGDLVLNGAYPELGSGMIPVIINDDGTITKANLNEEWYNYTNKKWANAVLVENDVRENYQNMSAGETIDQSKVLAYYVWVPRYKYQIFTTKDTMKIQQDVSLNITKLINIQFENKSNKSTGTKVGEWVTHPAFTFGSVELNGIWVGKFETSGTADKPTILPNQSSLMYQTVSEQFVTSLKFANNTLNTDGSISHTANTTYGINDMDAHMMKNTEWGAVVYLATSNYGQGTTEIRKNNSATFTTGCAATNEKGASYDGCENAYNTAIGGLASSTGNITGIYDMNGGTWEYVMGVMEDALGSNVPVSGTSNDYNSGFNGIFTIPSDNVTELTTGVNFPASKYYDLYSYGTTDSDLTAYKRGLLGDATYEMGSFINASSENVTWNNARAYFVWNNCPWQVRGGHHADGDSGIYSFASDLGRMTSFHTFRSVLVK